ncbi:hypothetical protein F4678DRAFT_446728 [Xylaria arbuscula]|nr:hypothetical protein F4678DRAFT_446728 [Xylaria arbuscula]
MCRKCDSSPTNPAEGPTLWHCAPHLRLVETRDDVSVVEAEGFFERAVRLWPVDHQRRYFRRKGDEAARGVGWSY